MGYTRIQTYILESEPGTSLEAAAWDYEAGVDADDWNHSKANAGKRRTDQPMGAKKRYGKLLNDAPLMRLPRVRPVPGSAG
jgi:hypothetical protein